MPHDPLPILGRITSGVYILTIGQGDGATGMLASWVMQAGFDPPMVTVAVRQGRYVAEWLARGEPFILNVAGEQHKSWLKHFGKGFEPGEPAFEGLDVHKAASGVPYLVDALGYLECTPTQHVDSEDHHVYLATVASGELLNHEPPMVHIRKSGSHY